MLGKKTVAVGETVCKVPVERLDIGMYVHDVNCGWLDHPFLGRSFLITGSAQIDKIKQIGIREIYIDLERSRKSEPAEAQSISTTV